MTVSWVPKTITGVGNLLEYPQGSEVIVLIIMIYYRKWTKKKNSSKENDA